MRPPKEAYGCRTLLMAATGADAPCREWDLEVPRIVSAIAKLDLGRVRQYREQARGRGAVPRCGRAQPDASGLQQRVLQRRVARDEHADEAAAEELVGRVEHELFAGERAPAVVAQHRPSNHRRIHVGISAPLGDLQEQIHAVAGADARHADQQLALLGVRREQRELVRQACGPSA
jgi:hypothetical protein